MVSGRGSVESVMRLGALLQVPDPASASKSPYKEVLAGTRAIESLIRLVSDEF